MRKRDGEQTIPTMLITQMMIFDWSGKRKEAVMEQAGPGIRREGEEMFLGKEIGGCHCKLLPLTSILTITWPAHPKTSYQGQLFKKIQVRIFRTRWRLWWREAIDYFDYTCTCNEIIQEHSVPDGMLMRIEMIWQQQSSKVWLWWIWPRGGWL